MKRNKQLLLCEAPKSDPCQRRENINVNQSKFGNELGRLLDGHLFNFQKTEECFSPLKAYYSCLIRLCFASDHHSLTTKLTLIAVVFGSFFLGIFFMVFHYVKLHPNKADIPLCLDKDQIPFCGKRTSTGETKYKILYFTI